MSDDLDRRGDPESELADVYAQLRALADRQMRFQPKHHTLQASALVNEAWLRLKDAESLIARDREHFLAIAATAMRQILVDHARRKQAVKRAAGERVSLQESALPVPSEQVDLLGFEDLLLRLESSEPRKAKVVELRVFGGMTIEEVARALGVSHMTVSTDWKIACAWLSREFSRAP